MCASIMPGLALTRANAQDGYLVSRSIATVVQHGKNQRVGDIRLEYSEDGGAIDAGETVTIGFRGLPITAMGTVTCSGGSCNAELTKADAADPAGTAIAVAVSGQSDGGTILLSGARVDVSGLDAGEEVVAAISSLAPTGLIPVGRASRRSVSAAVAEVKVGLAVEITPARRLLCNLALDEEGNPIGGKPAIAVKEGFVSAWEADAIGDTGTMITIETRNLPAGVMLRWPESMTFTDPADENLTWSTLTLTGDAAADAVIGETSTQENDGSRVTYLYSVQNAAAARVAVESFRLEPEVRVDANLAGTGGIADIRAFLSPAPADGDGNLGSVLSYAMSPVTDPAPTDPEGRIVDFAQCVTYLLFPYLNCGAYPNWTTRIAIANTTRDDGVFGLSSGAVEQSGNVVLHAFPRSTPTFDGASGRVPEARVIEVTPGLAAGDTVTFTCNQGKLARFEGYAIARAGFRHAHGVAFILVEFRGGADIDLAFGYLALVIPDPEFGGQRVPAGGESLGH